MYVSKRMRWCVKVTFYQLSSTLQSSLARESEIPWKTKIMQIIKRTDQNKSLNFATTAKCKCIIWHTKWEYNSSNTLKLYITKNNYVLRFK